MHEKGLKNNVEYDAIIIGAGIGGLTCGCYLAKAGLKVLIVEQHFKAGGYCTSFKRKGFTFDATTHYLGSFRANGILRKIYEELELASKVEITRFNPSNVVIYPTNKLHIWNDLNETISEFQDNFGDEANGIENFFKFIWDSDFSTLYLRLRDRTFEDLLNEYFNNELLKSMLGLFLGNIGSPASKASALSSVILFREFIIDGGYYPKGGMQNFSDAFVQRFKELGGEIILGKEAKKIVVNDSGVEGVVIDKDNFISSKTVVSNCDATNTLLTLVGKEHIPAKFIKRLNSLEISPSAFIVYLGLNKDYSNILKDRCSWWCALSSDLSIEKIYSDLDRKHKPYSEDFVFCVFPSSHDSCIAPSGKEIVYLITPAKMTNNNYWQENKNYLAEDLITKADKFIPGLSSSIEIQETATPLTMFRYTLNKHGASYGWTSTLSQINKEIMPPKTFIEGLYLSGHWATQGTGQGGISTVAYCGMNVAKQILKNLNPKRR